MVNRLKRKLVLSIALLFIILLIIIMGILYMVMEESFSNSAKNTAFSINNSIYIAMDEMVFSGIDIASFVANDPMVHNYFFVDETANQKDLQVYLKNIADIYGFSPLYLCSYGTDLCYGADGFIQAFSNTSDTDTWFYDKKANSDPSSPYESLLIANDEGSTDFYITYVITDNSNQPLGLFMLNINYNYTLSSIWEKADDLNANIYLAHPNGSYQDPLLSNDQNSQDTINHLPIKSFDQSGDFNFYTENDTYIAYRFIDQMNRYIIITQKLSDDMLNIFIMTFLIVTLVLLMIVLIVLRFYTNSSKKIIHHASIDTLTGVLNRSSYNDKLGDAMELCSKFNITSTLIFIDIDYFKKINDTCGHDIGDNIIKSVADLLIATKRKDDHLFRWGGDEFAIIARCSLEDALGLSRRILNNAHEIKWCDDKNLTLSIGVSELKATDNKKDCFNRADQSLYHAKEQGRDQICYI